MTMINDNVNELDTLNTGFENSDSFKQNAFVVLEVYIPTESKMNTPKVTLLIEMVIAINFNLYPCPKWNSIGNITITDWQYATKEERFMTLIAVKNWGFCSQNIKYYKNYACLDHLLSYCI